MPPAHAKIAVQHPPRNHPHTTQKKWWKESVIYQINIRSFNDSNGDGIGDLNGILQKLDYLKNLGVTMIWITPHYDSPNDDNGYDIRNYRKIMQEYGSMGDFDHLVRELKRRQMGLMIDIVFNHTSSTHPWFKKSRASLTNPFRDYYFWQNPKGGKEPNNDSSFFTGSAWQFDSQTHQYYLHYFSKSQPDLNWDNPKVRSALYDHLKFWLDKGVTGLRFDTIATISKVPGFPDIPARIAFPQAYTEGPKLHTYLQEMQRCVLSKYDVVSLGEMVGIPNERLASFYDEDRQELNAAINLKLVYSDRYKGQFWKSKPFRLSAYMEVIDALDRAIGDTGWNTFYLANHDSPRAVSHFGDDSPTYRKASAKAIATLLMTQRATPIIYQGDEIGMTNYPFTSIDDIKEIEGINNWKTWVLTGKISAREFFHYARKTARDNARTPFQWDASQNAGFTRGTPWMKVNPNYRSINAQHNLSDPDSIYHHYRRLIALRHAMPSLIYGRYTNLDPANDHIYAYTRSLADETSLIVINFTAAERVYPLPLHQSIADTIMQSGTAEKPPTGASVLLLKPWQSGIYRLSPASKAH